MIPAEFIRLVEFETGLEPGEIAGPSRLKPIVRVRTALVRVMRDLVRVDQDTGEKKPRFSLTQIGNLLNRDHSTMCAALERSDKLARADASFVALCDRIRGLAEHENLEQELVARQVSAAANRAEIEALTKQIPAVNAAQSALIAQRNACVFAQSLKRKVRARNDMLADDHDAIGRARGSIKLLEAIAAARAA